MTDPWAEERRPSVLIPKDLLLPVVTSCLSPSGRFGEDSCGVCVNCLFQAFQRKHRKREAARLADLANEAWQATFTNKRRHQDEEMA